MDRSGQNRIVETRLEQNGGVLIVQLCRRRDNRVHITGTGVDRGVDGRDAAQPTVHVGLSR
jgi:hypothetical protein